MIILDSESAILRNILERSLKTILTEEPEEENLSDYYNFNDFDGVRYKIVYPNKEEKKKVFTTIQISMFIGCAKEIAQYGGDERYQKLYSPYIIEAEPGFSHTLKVDFTQVEKGKIPELIKLIANFKANVLAAPILWAAEKVAKKEKFEIFEVPVRQNSAESLWIAPSDAGVTAIFAIKFNDRMDSIFGSVFFQELIAAKTKVKSAPPVAFSYLPPKELANSSHASITIAKQEEGKPVKSDAGVEQRGRTYAFVSLSLLGPQLREDKKEFTAFQVPLLRDYIHYHIKCTKGFLHQRMRAKTAAFLKALEAAKPLPKQVQRRGVSGKIIH